MAYRVIDLFCGCGGISKGFFDTGRVELIGATLPDEAREYWVQDASAATENLLLAAHALNLGAVWCGVYPIKANTDYVSGLLELPDSIVPLNVVIIGHHAESPEPKDKWKPENIHYEKW